MPEAGFASLFLRKLLLNFRDVCIFFGCDFLIFRFELGQTLQLVVEGGDFGVVEFADEGHDIPGGIFGCFLSSISDAACSGVSVRLTVSEVTSTIVAVSGSLFTAVVSSGTSSVLGGQSFRLQKRDRG